jgi:hypothetical protein
LEILTTLVEIQKAHLARNRHLVRPILERVVKDYQEIDGTVGYAQRLRQLQGVLQNLLDCQQPVSAKDGRHAIEEALVDLGLSQDKFLRVLFGDMLSETGADVLPVSAILREYARIKDHALVSSFVTNDTV